MEVYEAVGRIYSESDGCGPDSRHVVYSESDGCGPDLRHVFGSDGCEPDSDCRFATEGRELSSCARTAWCIKGNEVRHKSRCVKKGLSPIKLPGSNHRM